MKLSDLMTAEQALKILEKLEAIEKRLENAENEIKALKYEATWGEITRIVESYKNYEN